VFDFRLFWSVITNNLVCTNQSTKQYHIKSPVLFGIKMTACELSPSTEVFRMENHNRMKDYDSSHSNQGRQRQPIPQALIPARDLETMRSRPDLTKNGSMQSFTTQWSTATTQTSNTTKRQCEKRQKKKKFLHFLKILMRIVKKKDEGRFRNARAVICDCEDKKKRGEIDSISHSLRCSLKDAVGPQFWKEAQDCMSKTSWNSKAKNSSIGTAVGSDNHSKGTATTWESFAQSRATNGKGKSNDNDAIIATMNAATSRKKRIWMVIRLFMQHLRSGNCQHYSKAHALVNECVRRHKRIKHFENSNSLSGSIQACLTKEFGLEHWRRAENDVAEMLPVFNEDRR